MTIAIQTSVAVAITVIVTFWTGTLLVVYEMMSSSLSATLFIYGLAAVGLVAVYNLMTSGGRKIVR